MKLTVCICTYNRASLLEGALAALAAAKAPGEGLWELLLIDNNSPDETAQVATRFETRLPLRYLVEEKQGLSHARNRAIEECRGNLLVFTDDDVRVETGWIEAYLDAARRFPEAEFFGGRVLPDWSAGRPKWFRDEDMPLLSGLTVKNDQGGKAYLAGPDDALPFGASFGIRRRLFERLARFRPDLGPVGSSPGRGDDVEYLGRARDQGAVGAYVAEAVSYHWVDPKRLTLAYLYRYGIEKGVAASRMGEDERTGGSIVLEVSYFARGVFQLLRGRGDRFRQCIVNMGIQAGMRREFREVGQDR